MWRDLTENVNFMAGSLTTQVRAIADVSTAVTQGDLTRSIDVEAKGEVSDLKDNVNQMISTLRDTTQRNAEQDWLNSNLARFGGMMQGQRDLKAVSRLIMSELTPLVLAHHGAFFVAEGEDDEAKLRLVASYGYKQRKKVANEFKVGEALVGQTALEKQSILITDPPDDYIRIASALGEAVPRNIIVMPVLFEDEVMAVIELAAFHAFTPAQLTFMEQLAETIGVVLNTIQANMRTEELLDQSQSLAQELQSQSEELQTQQEELQQRNEELEETAATLRASEELLQQQQEELQQTNEELEEKARQLEEQNARIEIKNQEIELARSALEEKAEQLALSSKYKSEFLANMSHELRTPLNSLLILAKLLGDNPDGNLTPKQVEFSSTIHSAGSDLLDLINDILDLSKVEAGKMDLATSEIPLTELRERIERAFQPVAEQKRLAFEVTVSGANVPPTIVTDPQRLEQILRNLLSNAFKFTDDGSVSLRIEAGPTGDRYMNEQLNHADGVVAFVVSDTGIGIPHDKLRLIFEAFQQADGTTSRRYGGTGLGLSISREIAVLLGGEIRVESSPGKGASFTLYLPATYAPPAERAPAPPALPAPSNGDLTTEPVEEFDSSLLLPSEVSDDREQLSDSDRVVLVVEDDAGFARTVQEVARERGFKTLVALRGDTGLALAHEYKPDAIVLDLKLPVIDGAALLDRLKRHPATRHIPVHIVSAGDGRQQALRAGAFAFLEKPIAREGLEDTFASLATFIDRGVRNLLVVEDDENQRNAIVELVGVGDDVNVVAVGSTDEALAALEATRFDCMVLDLKLPGKGGFSLLERVKKSEEHRGVPVIVYTGEGPHAPGGNATEEVRGDDHRQGRPLTRAAARRDRALPPPRRDAPAARAPARARAAALCRRGLPGTEDPDRRRRRAERLRAREHAGEPRHGGRLRRERPGGAREAGGTPGRRPRPDGRDDAGARRLRDHAGRARAGSVQEAADHRAHRQGDEGRPREVDRGGRVRLHHEARRHRPAPVPDARLALPVGTSTVVDRDARRRGDRGRAPARGDRPPLRLRLSRVRAGVAEAAALAPRPRRGARRRSPRSRTGCCTTRPAWSACCSTSRST